MMPQRPCHKKLRIFAPEPEISDYASEDYYDNLPPEDYEDFQEDYGPYPEDVPSEEFPPSMVLREMTHQSRLISHLRNSCSINYLI